MRNLALNRLERERTAKRNAVLTELDGIADAAGVPFDDALAESDALAKTIDRFLTGRSKIEVIVFARRYFSGETGRDISRATGLSPVKISRMLKRLRRDLAEELKKGGN